MIKKLVYCFVFYRLGYYKNKWYLELWTCLSVDGITDFSNKFRDESTRVRSDKVC